MNLAVIRDFDIQAFFGALDSKRRDEGLSWAGAAKAIWDLTPQLNVRSASRPISPATLTNLPKRGATSCQHAAFFLRWLGRPAESFVPGVELTPAMALPEVGPDRRLRFDLTRLYDALNSQRLDESLTWRELAQRLRCEPGQLSGIRTAKFAVEIRLTMRIVQWLEAPAADFMYAAEH